MELQRIDAEKAVEVEKKEIANVIRERIAVDKTVTIEEERIKEVREVSEADRAKQVQVLAAEAVAEQEKVKDVKAAQASQEAASHKAVEITTLAQADLEAASKESEAKKKLAEGIQAEQAAPGLAEAKVQEAKADALEKEGMAEAAAIAGKGTAQANAQRDIGMSGADVITATGSADAKAKREVGMAGAEVTREQFKAEADGLVEKFSAMSTMSPAARQHEEYRRGLEIAFKEAIAAIEAGKDIAKENAQVLSTALREANKAMGGDDTDIGGRMVGQLVDLVSAVDALKQAAVLASQPTKPAVTEKHIVAMLKGLTRIGQSLQDNRPQVEVFNQPVPGMDRVLQTLADTIEHSFMPMVRHMDRKLEVDLDTHYKIEHVGEQIRALQSQLAVKKSS